MKRLIRIADLQLLVIILNVLLSLPQDGLRGLPVSLVFLNTPILAFTLWLRSAGPWYWPAGGFWGPWPKYWVPVRFLGGMLALLNLTGAIKLAWASWPMAGAERSIWLYVLVHATFALLFFWASRLPAKPRADSRWIRNLWSLPHLVSAAAALSLFWGATQLGLPAAAGLLSGLALATGLGALWTRGVPRPLTSLVSDGQIDPAWLKAVRDSAAQEERNRLARDLHDSIKQQLFTIQMAAATVRARWQHDPEGAGSALGQVERAVREAMAEARALLQQLRPQALAGSGLVEALREQCEALGFRTGAEVNLELGDSVPDERLPFDTAEMLFRIAQEALANVARHARPQRVTIFLGRRADDLVLEVRDDGQGFDVARATSGMGLRNLRERALQIGADLRLASRPGEGTTLVVSVGLRPADEGVELPPPARAWLLERLYKNERGMWWLFLFAGLFSGFAVQVMKETLSWNAVPLLAIILLGSWTSMRREARKLMRDAAAWQPPLSPRDLASLRSSLLRVYVVAALLGIMTLLIFAAVPLRTPLDLRTAIFTLAGFGTLAVTLYRFQRESEAGGWVYSFRRWLRRPGRDSFWVVVAVVIVLPYYPYLRSLLAILTRETWVTIFVWGAFAVYLGIRRAKRPD